ncbi:RHS repeat-associated protein [Cytobacillus purgationiresistens]|uniref:RHS repeat-associated protein n=1 Tax=Cytobacillus purgationiresistens TaxID=863449 RepID=A0ABU0ALS5_9BACI|nr:RHS repeat-associated protein [Cytobacillus purgationiresistens]
MVKANPFRYVGKFGVQYDEDTKLYFMGWREYDAKIGRFLVADEYEGEDDNPISFNRYLYAESDPVNNIDPDGYAPKWLKKLGKGVKKAAKATYNFAVGDDIRTLKSKKTKWYQKAGAAISIASNFIPGGGIASKAIKAAVKGTSKAFKASKAVKKTTKVVKAPAKKVVAKINKKPKTVAAKPIRTSPKVESKAKVKVAASVKSAPKAKTRVAPKPTRGVTWTRVEKSDVTKDKKIVSSGSVDSSNIEPKPKLLMKLDLQLFAGKGTSKIPSSNTKVIELPEKTAPRPVKPQDATKKWEEFLGEGEYSNIHPIKGTPDPNRIFSADGKRSIRYGTHEMGSKPTKHHYHEEIWDYDPIKDTMTYSNTIIRVPIQR